MVFRVSERLQIAPSVEVLGVPEGHFVNLSLDALLALDCACNPASRVWAGAGVALISRDDGAETDVKPGLDLLLGFGVRAGGLIPYAQIKAILKDRPEVVIGVGLRF